MILTPQDAEYLISQGLNPDEYELDETGSSYVPKQAQSVSTAVVGTEFPHPKIDTFGPFGTATGTFVHQAPSAVAGGVAFGRTLGPSMALAKVVPGPPIVKVGAGLVPPILAGMGASGVTGWLQNILEQPLVKAASTVADPLSEGGVASALGGLLTKLQTSQAENPKSAFAGNIATMPLAGMWPSPTRAIKAAQYGLPWLASKATGSGYRPPVEQIPNIMNVGIGAALQPAVATGRALATGEDITAKDLALETLLGALFNRPNALGKLYGFTDIPGIASEAPGGSALPGRAELATEVAAPVETMPPAATQDIQAAGQPLVRGTKQIRKETEKQTAAYKPADATTRWKESPFPSEAELARLEGEGGPTVETMPEQVTTERPKFYTVPEPIQLPDKPFEPIPAERALVRTMPEQQAPVTPIRRDPSGKIVSGRVLSEEPVTRRPRTAFEQEVEQAAEVGAMPTKPTSIWKRMMDAWGLHTRGVTVKEDGTLVGDTGKPIAGEAFVEKAEQEFVKKGVREAADRLVSVNPQVEGLGTRAHEIFHFFIKDLEASPHAYDKILVKKFYDLVGKSKDFKAINEARVASGRKPWTVNEYITTEQEAQFLNRQLGISGEKPMQTWWKDFTSHLKTRYSKDATPADFRRMLNYRFQNDPAFSKYFAKGLETAASTGRTISEEPTMRPGDRAISIRTPEGKIIPAVTNDKYWEFGGEKRLNVGRQVEDRWSDGPLRPGETVIERSLSEEPIGPKDMGQALSKLYDTDKKEYFRLMRLQDRAMQIASQADASGDPRFAGIESILNERPTTLEAFENKLNRILAKSIGFPNRFQSEEPSLVPINDPKVADIIDATIAELQNKTETAESNAKELQTTLLAQVNLPKNLRDKLESIDTSNPVGWAQFRGALRNTIAGKEVVPSRLIDKTIEPEAEELPQVTPKAEMRQILEQSKPVKREVAKFGTTPKEPKAAPAPKPEPIANLEQQRKLWANEWTEVNTTKEPAVLAKSIAQKILKATTPREQQHYRMQYQFLAEKHNLPDRLMSEEPLMSDVDETGVTRKQWMEKHGTFNHRPFDEFQARYSNYEESKAYAKDLLQEAFEDPAVIEVVGENYFKLHSKESAVDDMFEGLRSAAVSKRPNHPYGEYYKAIIKAQPELETLLGKEGIGGTSVNAENFLRLKLRTEHGLQNDEITAILRDYKQEGRARLYDIDPELGYFADAYNLGKYRFSSDFVPVKEKGGDLSAKEETQDKRLLSEEPSLARQPGEGKFQSEESLFATRAGRVLSHLVAPEIEKVRLHSPEGAKAAKGLTEFYRSMSRLRGKLEQRLIRNLRTIRGPKNLEEFWKQDNEDYRTVVKWLDLKSDGIEPKFALTPIQKEIEQAVRANLLASHKMREERPELAHKTSADPYYLPHTMSRDAASELAERPGSDKSKAYYRDFLAYQQKHSGLTLDQAKEAWITVRGAFTKEAHNLAQKFGPVDKASGIGLPISMREQNLMDRMSRFNRRYARRVAYHDAIEQNKEASEALFNPELGVESTQEAKNVLEDIYGVREHLEAKRNAILGIVRAGMLGPLTGAKDFVSNLALGLQHQDASQWLPGIASALKDFRANYQRAIDTGSVRYNISGLEVGEGGIDNVIKNLHRARDVINSAQGRQALESATRIVAFGQGRYLAVDALAALRAKKLSFQKTKFLKDFVPNWEKYKDTVANEDVVNEAAAAYVDSVQGTYDYRGQPALTMRGTFAPILSLARWNVEKFNNFVKYNIDPARQGDWKPLLMSTLGMLVGGAAVSELVETVTGRKDRVPTLKEIGAADEKTMLAAYKLANLSSMAGYGGLMGDLFRSAMDVQFKNRPQIYNNPLIDGLATGAENTQFLIEAMRAGDIPAVADVLHNVLQDYFQAYRIGVAHLSTEKKEELEKRAKLRDLKIFKAGEGLPLSPYSSERPNPYLDQELREFKETRDLGEAVKLLPGLLEKAVEKSEGNPEQLKAELTKLKLNSYQTFPNPATLPKRFYDYYVWLSETQGPEEAAARLNDYLTQNAVNKAKSKLVP